MDDSIGELPQNFEHGQRFSDFSSYSYWYIGYPIPRSMACAMFLVAQYAEIAIQITYFVLISTASLLFKELEERLKSILEYSNPRKASHSELFRKMENWNQYYDLVCRLVEKINECFNPILFITIGYLFVTSSTSVSEMVRSKLLNHGQSAVINGVYHLNNVALLKSGQGLLKLFIFLVPTVILKSRVRIFTEAHFYFVVFYIVVFSFL